MASLPGSLDSADDGTCVSAESWLLAHGDAIKPPDGSPPEMRAAPSYSNELRSLAASSSNGLFESSQQQIGLLVTLIEQQEKMQTTLASYHEDVLDAVKHKVKVDHVGLDSLACSTTSAEFRNLQSSDKQVLNRAAPAQVKPGIRQKSVDTFAGDLDELAELHKQATAIGTPTFFGKSLSMSSQTLTTLEPLAKIRHYCKQVIHHRGFEIGIAVLILLNAVGFASLLEWQLANKSQQVPGFFRALDIIFTILFTLELIVRIIVEGCHFWGLKNHNQKWNAFDTFLVFMSLLDEVFSHMTWTFDVMALRILRILRIVRLLRAFRILRFFSDLRVMVLGITRSLKSLVWALTLLLLVMFIFAVFLMYFVAEELATSVSNDVEHVVELNELYGSFGNTLLTLFMSISGGDDWTRFVQPLRDINEALILCFCAYVIFATFCVLNIVTGVFVDNATKITANDEDELFAAEIELRQQHIEDIKKVFLVHDMDNDKELDFDEFKQHMSDVRTKFALRRLGLDLDTVSLEHLFVMLDFDQSGAIDVNEFILGIRMFHGGAKSIDVAKVLYDLGIVRQLVTEMVSLILPGARGAGDEDEDGVQLCPAEQIRRWTVQDRTASAVTTPSARKTSLGEELE